MPSINNCDSSNSTSPGPVFIIVMGVCGTGKSTLGTALAKSLGLPFIEGDDLHPKANVDKMSAGIPLNDADREPWLELVRKTAEDVVGQPQAKTTVDSATEGNNNRKVEGVVGCCSSLKKYYREILRGQFRPSSGASDGSAIPAPSDLRTYFVYIHATREVVLERMEKRAGHFMKPSMLDSQLDTLEDPTGEEGVVSVDLQSSTEEQVRTARTELGKMIGVEL